MIQGEWIKMDQKKFREFYRTIQDVAEHPAIMGHEFAGDIIKV